MSLQEGREDGVLGKGPQRNLAPHGRLDLLQSLDDCGVLGTVLGAVRAHGGEVGAEAAEHCG